MASFEKYNSWRKQLISLIDDTITATKAVSPERAKVYEVLRKQLQEDTFKVQVVGTVKNGKSSFTNALIGENILPVDDIPCTAIASEVKYGPEKKAIVSFYSPLPTGLLNEIPAETAAYLRSKNLGKDSRGKDVPIEPMGVPYDMMQSYVAIPEAPMEVMMDEIKFKQFQERIAMESPFDVATLTYPAEMLKDGVQLVDSPGLNEHPRRTSVTLDYLRQADAAIYLLDVSKSITLDEKKVIETVLLPLGFKDLIMVGNRADLVKRREVCQAYLQANVRPYTTQKRCFAVSAKQYLDGKKAGDNKLMEESGIPEFKEFLIDFLTKKKGELKIKKITGQIVNSIKTDFFENIIPKRLAALEADTLVIQQRVNEARPKLTAVTARRMNMAQAFEKNIPLALVPIKQTVVSFFEKLQKQIPQWIAEYKAQHDWGFVPNRSDLEAIANETIEDTKAKVEAEFKKWNESTLQPIMMEQCNMVFGRVEDDVMDMAKDIAVIENILSGAKGTDTEASNVVERMAGIAAMAFLPMGRAGGDLFAGGFNMSEFLKNFIVDLGVSLGVGLLAMWVWPPLGFIAAIIGVIWGLMQGATRRISDMKKKLTENIVDGIRKDTPVRVSKMLDEIRTTFNAVQKSVMEGVDSEIEATRNQLDELVRICNNDQEKIQEQKMTICKAGSDLTTAVDSMNELIAKIDSEN